MKYNKREFAELLKKRGYTQKDALAITNDFISVLSEILFNHDSVTFSGFGNFEVKHRKAPDGDVLLPQKRSAYIKFTQSKAFKDELTDHC